MPVAITESIAAPLPLDPPRKTWTREECHALAESGLLRYEPFELIEGELIRKMSKLRPHTNSIRLLIRALTAIFTEEFVDHETPIDVAPEDNPASEPEADVMVLKRPGLEFKDRNPQPAELLLLVEVASTTLRFDCGVKARLYARAGIVDYWVLDVKGRRLIVHRDPRGGEYQSIASYGETESVAPLASPDSTVRVADLFA